MMTEKEFTVSWIKKLSDGELKSFPENFITDSDKTEVVNLPGIDLILGEELFGSYDLLDTKHNSVMMIGDYYSAKYIIYANRKKPASTRIPASRNEIVETVKAYESYLDGILKLIRKDYTSKFLKGNNSHNVLNDIFNHLNIKRI